MPHPPGLSADRAATSRLDTAGTGLAALGAGTVLFSFNEPEWLGHATTYADLQERASAGDVHGPVSPYFAFGGWLVFGFVVLAVVFARYVGDRFRLVRAAVAAALALGGAATAWVACGNLVGTDGLPDRIGPGVYVSVAGFVVLAISTVLTRRRRPLPG